MFFNNRRVLITGGAGLTGCTLIQRLLSEGAIIRATLHQRGPVVVDDRIEYVRCDLTKAEDCRRAVEAVRYVFHCAAHTSAAGVTDAAPMAHVTSNLLINAQMLEAAYAARVEKFLWPGSTTGYPPSGDRPVKEEEMLDGEPYVKYFCVGWEKRFMEILCEMYGEKVTRPMTTIVLRATSIYGPNDDFEPSGSHVTPALIRKVVERQDPIEVWGTGDDIRDVIHVDDIVEAMVIAMERIESYTAINIGLGKAYSVKELLQIILEIDGYTDARIVFNASKPAMIPIRLVDTTNAEKVLGFKAKTNLREGLRKTIEWYRESRNIPRPHSRCGIPFMLAKYCSVI